MFCKTDEIELHFNSVINYSTKGMCFFPPFFLTYIPVRFFFFFFPPITLNIIFTMHLCIQCGGVHTLQFSARSQCSSYWWRVTDHEGMKWFGLQSLSLPWASRGARDCTWESWKEKEGEKWERLSSQGCRNMRIFFLYIYILMPMLSVPQWYIEKLAIRRAVLIGSKTKPIQIVVATLQKKKSHLSKWRYFDERQMYSTCVLSPIIKSQ